MRLSRNVGVILGVWCSLVLLVSGGLSGCGTGGASSLNTTGPGSGAGNLTPACTPSSSVSCISGRFVDDVVAGLHYTCADSNMTVQAVTDAGGVFSCPSDSGQVDFYLADSTGTYKIDLGTAPVTQTSDSNGLTSSGYLAVTPRTLAGDEKNDTYSNYSLNVSRLLYLFDPDQAQVSSTAPDQVISLTTSDQQQISVLAVPVAGTSAVAQTLTVLGAADFADSESAFNQKLLPLINALGRTLPSQAVAQNRLDAMLNATRAGLYTDPGSLLANTTVNTAGFFGCDAFNGSLTTGTTSPCSSASNSQELFALPYLLLDRAGRSLGFAITSLSKCAGGCANSPTSVLTNPQLASMTTQMTPFMTFSRGGLFTNQWVMPNGAGNLNLQITQGRLYRDHILDNAPDYQSTYGASVQVPMADLGLFIVQNSTIQGTYALTRTVPVAPTLDPALWPNQIFPLYLQLSFAGVTAAGSTTVLGVVILPDGNIVTDLKQSCATIDPATLKDANGVQQWPVGVVANILSNGSAHYLSPVFVFPANAAIPAALQGVVIGADSNTASVRLRLDAGGSNVQYQLFGNSVAANGQIQPDNSTNPAQWMSLPGFYSEVAANINNLNSATNIAQTTGIVGNVTAQLESCAP